MIEEGSLVVRPVSVPVVTVELKTVSNSNSIKQGPEATAYSNDHILSIESVKFGDHDFGIKIVVVNAKTPTIPIPILCPYSNLKELKVTYSTVITRSLPR